MNRDPSHVSEACKVKIILTVPDSIKCIGNRHLIIKEIQAVLFVQGKIIPGILLASINGKVLL